MDENIKYKNESHTGIGDGYGVTHNSTWSDMAMSVFGEVLHEEGGFTIRSNDQSHKKGRFTENRFPSVIQHECSEEESDYKKNRTIRKIWQGTWSAELDGVCQRCHVKIPIGLLTLWKLHNWDALQEWLGGLHGKD